MKGREAICKLRAPNIYTVACNTPTSVRRQPHSADALQTRCALKILPTASIHDTGGVRDEVFVLANSSGALFFLSCLTALPTEYFDLKVPGVYNI